MHVPVQVGDFSDFFASFNHAKNCAQWTGGDFTKFEKQFWLRPLAYHGRNSSIVISGTPITRPCGQVSTDDSSRLSDLVPTKAMDFELEFACYLGGKLNKVGERIPARKASDFIFGFSLLNDWSARDIQMFEMMPLGPFLSKNFGTSVSPWIVTVEALTPFLVDNDMTEPKTFPYLLHDEKFNFDINLEASIKRLFNKFLALGIFLIVFSLLKRMEITWNLL